jgi:hypothetical protein
MVKYLPWGFAAIAIIKVADKFIFAFCPQYSAKYFHYLLSKSGKFSAVLILD